MAANIVQMLTHLIHRHVGIMDMAQFNLFGVRVKLVVFVPSQNGVIRDTMEHFAEGNRVGMSSVVPAAQCLVIQRIHHPMIFLGLRVIDLQYGQGQHSIVDHINGLLINQTQMLLPELTT